MKESQSQSYFTSDDQSWCEPTLGLVTRYYFLSEGFCLKVAILSLWGALFDERTSLQFTVQSLNGPSRAEPVTILYCRDSPNLESQVPVLISPRNRVAKLYPRALGSLYVASYDSQGYGEGILTHHHSISSCQLNKRKVPAHISSTRHSESRVI
jgi:hypothetical protein